MSSRLGAFRLERIRSFGTTFSDTKRLLRENLPAFLGVLILLIGPFALITCTLGIYSSNFLFNGKTIFQYTNTGSFLFFSTLLMHLRSLLNGLFSALVISHFLKVCREKGSGKFTVHDVTSSLLKDAVMGGLLYMILFLLCLVIGAGIGGLFAWMASASVVEFSFFTVIGSVVYILLRYPFWYLIFSVFMARGAEIRTGDRSRPGLLGSFRLPLQILPGHWWGTWVLLFSAWALFMVVGYLVTLPSSLGMEILKMLSIEPEYDATTKKMVETIFMTINEFARTLVNCSFCVVLGIHFYSLKESKHGYTITEQLNQIGHTQPDDHVEYVY